MIRFSKEAEQNMIEESYGLFEFTGDQAAGLSLYNDFYAHAATLATLPDRQIVRRAESRALGVEARRLVVRSRFHLIYRIEDGEDGPLVVVTPHYEPPKQACHNALRQSLRWVLDVIGILAVGLLALLLFERLVMRDCYDKNGVCDDTCSQGYERKTP